MKNRLSRRALLAGAATLAAFEATAQSDAPTLAAAARRAGLLFGASLDRRSVDAPALAALYQRETDILVTDTAMKFDFLRPRQDVFDFHNADAIVSFAKASGKLLRGHTLIWNDSATTWLKRLSLSEIEREFDRHVDCVAERYAGALHSWDVVNEPFWPMDRQKGGWRAGPWFAAMGPAYIERAFRRVRAIDKQARLTLNEAQADTNHEWGRQIRPLLADLVKRLLDRGAPVDSIGLQSHLRPHWPHDNREAAAYAQSLADLGLDIYVTELDVADQHLPEDPAARDRLTAEAAGAYLAEMLKVDRLRLVTTWQLSDLHSWYREPQVAGRNLHRARPLPFDDRLSPKPMRAAMIRAFLDARR